MKSTNFLIQEHKVILRALDVLDTMRAGVENSGKVDEGDLDKILDFLRWFADAHHQAKEETVLFPALRAAGSTQDRPVRHMMLEHEQERGLVEGLEKDVRLGNPADFISNSNRLSSTLRNHIYKEDHILFEAADDLMDAAKDEAVFEQLNRFDTPLDKEVLALKLQDLRSLERTYLRK